MVSLPGIAMNSAARLLISVGGGSAFKAADQLAVFAGLAPVIR